MKIPINKDIEKEYKDIFAAGFTWKECVWIALSAAIIFGAGILQVLYLGVDLSIVAYTAVPCGIPTVFLGFYKSQGLSIFELLMEIYYESRTKTLPYEADELPEIESYFTMEHEKGGNEKWKK